MVTRYRDAPASTKGTTVETGNWFQDYARDILEKMWGISPKSYHSSEFQLKYGEGRFAEYKHDPHSKYKHLAIEVGERAQREGAWTKAGIFRAEEPFYIQGDESEIWVFPTHMLKQYANDQGIDWCGWELIDANRITKIYNSTMIRFFLEYDEAISIGGIRINCKKE